MVSEGIFINGEKVTFNPENILNGDVSAYTEAIGEATQDWLDEHLEPGGSVPIDDTLTIAGAAADAKKTGDEISELKDDLYQLANQTYHPTVGGRIYNGASAGSTVDPTPQATASYAYLVVPVTAGDTFVITGTGNSAYRPRCFTDTSYKILVNDQNSMNNATVVAPANGYLICTFDKSYTYSVVKLNAYNDFSKETNRRLNEIESYSYKEYLTSDYTKGYHINTGYGTGTSGAGSSVDVTPISDADYSYLIIPCYKGDVYKITGTGAGTQRAWAFVTSDNKMVENSASYLTLTDEVLTSPVDGYLILNAHNSYAHSVTILYIGMPTIVRVSPDVSPSRAVFNTIKDAVEYANKVSGVTILVDSGVYDIIEELGGSDYTESLDSLSSYAGGLMLGNGTSIKGIGSGAKLTAIYTAGTNPVMTDRFSIFNIVGSFCLENIELEVTNVRYCVHEDMGALTAEPLCYTGIYKNCKMKHNGSVSLTYNIPACIGGGTMNNSEHIIDGCVLTSPENVNPCGYHNNKAVNGAVARVKMQNCYITNNGTIAFSIYGSATQVIEAEITNNHLGGAIADNSNGLFIIKSWNNDVAP